MAEYRVNEAAVAHARQLIDARQYVLRSEWGHKEIELAAHDLLQRLDAARTGNPGRR